LMFVGNLTKLQNQLLSNLSKNRYAVIDDPV